MIFVIDMTPGHDKISMQFTRIGGNILPVSFLDHQLFICGGVEPRVLPGRTPVLVMDPSPRWGALGEPIAKPATLAGFVLIFG